MLDGYARFFEKISPHPLLAKTPLQPDFSDIRFVSQDPGLSDFWNFLIDLDSEMMLCKTQEDVERLASSRPFRDDGAAVGARGDRPVRELADAVFTGGDSLGASSKAAEKKDTGSNQHGGGRRNSKAKQEDTEVVERDASVEALL